MMSSYWKKTIIYMDYFKATDKSDLYLLVNCFTAYLTTHFIQMNFIKQKKNPNHQLDLFELRQFPEYFNL